MRAAAGTNTAERFLRRDELAEAVRASGIKRPALPQGIRKKAKK